MTPTTPTTPTTNRHRSRIPLASARTFGFTMTPPFTALTSAACKAVVVLGLVVTASPALAQEDAPPSLVFVTDVTTTEEDLSADAKAVTAALCGAIARDIRVEVLCAPDVKQILGFAAMSAMTGAQSPAVAKLEERLSKVDFVVVPTLERRQKKVVLVAQLGPRSPMSSPTSPAVESVLLKVEEVSPGKAAQLLDRMPALANKLTGRVAQQVAASSTPAPPPPLGKGPPSQKAPGAK